LDAHLKAPLPAGVRAKKGRSENAERAAGITGSMKKLQKEPGEADKKTSACLAMSWWRVKREVLD